MRKKEKCLVKSMVLYYFEAAGLSSANQLLELEGSIFLLLLRSISCLTVVLYSKRLILLDCIDFIFDKFISNLGLGFGVLVFDIGFISIQFSFADIIESVKNIVISICFMFI